MGGVVAIAVRRNGRVTVRETNTGMIPVLCQSLSFLRGEEGPAQEAWVSWPIVPFAPSGYGLVIIDADTQWLTSIQNYSDPTHFMAATLQHEVHWRGGVLSLTDDPLDRGTLFQEAWEAGCFRQGRMLRYDENGTTSGPWFHRPLAELDLPSGWEGLMRRMFADQETQYVGPLRDAVKGEHTPPCDLLLGVKFEPPGWTLERLTDTPEGWRSLVSALLDRGFSFSAADDEGWREYGEGRWSEEVGAVRPFGILAEWQQARMEVSVEHPPARRRSTDRL